MFHGYYLILSTMQAGTTTIFHIVHIGITWTQQQLGIEPTKPLGQCWVPPVVTFYDEQGLLNTYSTPGSSIRGPNSGPPWGHLVKDVEYMCNDGHALTYLGPRTFSKISLGARCPRWGRGHLLLTLLCIKLYSLYHVWHTTLLFTVASSFIISRL